MCSLQRHEVIESGDEVNGVIDVAWGECLEFTKNNCLFPQDAAQQILGVRCLRKYHCSISKTTADDWVYDDG